MSPFPLSNRHHPHLDLLRHWFQFVKEMEEGKAEEKGRKAENSRKSEGKRGKGKNNNRQFASSEKKQESPDQ